MLSIYLILERPARLLGRSKSRHGSAIVLLAFNMACFVGISSLVVRWTGTTHLKPLSSIQGGLAIKEC